MTLVIPVWLLWTLGIVFGLLLAVGIGAALMFAWIGWGYSRSIGRGLGW
jgi:hypothetical protein